MLMWLAFIGLALIIIASYKWYTLIIAVIAGYYLVSTYVPDYFGYSVNAKYIGDIEGRVVGLYGTDYLVVVLKDEDEPRLVKVRIQQATRDNIKTKGYSIIRFNSKANLLSKIDGGGTGEEVFSDGNSYTEVDLNQSEQFKKDD